MLRQYLDTAFQPKAVFFQRQAGKLPGQIVGSEIGALQHMEQVKFDAVRAGFHRRPGGFYGHLGSFPGKAKDHVGDYVDICRLQMLYGIEIDLVFISPADIADGFRVDGLQSQLHGHGLYAVDFLQKGNHVVPEAVRSGADGKTHDFFRLYGIKI